MNTTNIIEVKCSYCGVSLQRSGVVKRSVYTCFECRSKRKSEVAKSHAKQHPSRRTVTKRQIENSEAEKAAQYEQFITEGRRRAQVANQKKRSEFWARVRAIERHRHYQQPTPAVKIPWEERKRELQDISLGLR